VAPSHSATLQEQQLWQRIAALVMPTGSTER
jgi:hypothetical protein